jgi:hypothetical protein
MPCCVSGSKCIVVSGSKCIVVSGSKCIVVSGSKCIVVSGSKCIVVSGSKCIVVSGSKCIVVSGSKCIVVSGSKCIFRRHCKIATSDYWLRHIRLSVRTEQHVSHWKEFCKILYLSVFRKSVEKDQVSLKYDKIAGTLHEDRYTLLIISRWILLRMRNVLDKICRENQNTHIFR